jgi:hypothetical protein
MPEPTIPADIRALYEEHDALRAIVEDPFATEMSKRRALRECWDVEDALERRQA